MREEAFGKIEFTFAELSQRHFHWHIVLILHPQVGAYSSTGSPCLSLLLAFIRGLRILQIVELDVERTFPSPLYMGKSYWLSFTVAEGLPVGSPFTDVPGMAPKLPSKIDDHHHEIRPLVEGVPASRISGSGGPTESLGTFALASRFARATILLCRCSLLYNGARDLWPMLYDMDVWQWHAVRLIDSVSR